VSESDTDAAPSTSPWRYDAFPRKVNLGCGWDRREGYLNVDFNAFHEPDLVADVTNLTELPSDYYEEVLAIDVLEHIPRMRCVPTLLEWNRILITGGVLRLQVPNIIGLVGLMMDPQRQSVAQQELLCQCLYGTQAYSGDFHFNGFTEVTLHSRLQAAGFAVVQLNVRDHWLFEVEAVKTSAPAFESWMLAESPKEFLSGAYHASLGREPDPDGERFYTQMLQDGTDRYVILEILRNSDEARSRG
jgi:hypothetical protein